MNNTDNHIVARATVIAITPSVQSLIGPEHQLFIAGRQMDRHIHWMNEHFYTNLAAKSPFFALFMDTKNKSSIHHSFIHRVLKRQSWPTWSQTFFRT
jgi:hypothetical protein